MFNARIAFLEIVGQIGAYTHHKERTGRIDYLVVVQASPVLHTRRDLARGVNTKRTTRFPTHITFIVLDSDDVGVQGGVQFLERFILLWLVGVCFLRDFDHLRGGRLVDRVWYSRSQSSWDCGGGCRS